MSHEKLNRINAVLVLLLVFISYLFIVSPTLCFWDCGEYVAAAHSLAVPHPPGNPLFMIIGRCFSMMLFFLKDVSFRLNLISSLSGALAAMLIYLSIVRIFIGFIGTPDTAWKKITVYCAGFVGALFAGFSSTVLFSVVESEVNAPLLVPIMLSTWLALVWAQSKEVWRDRYLFLIAYICFLGIGIHMYSMITLAPIFLFVVITDKEKLYDWRLWITSLICGLVMYDIAWFIWLGLAVSGITLVMSYFKGINQRKWRFCFWLVFFALLGFTVHLYIPIRSSLNPMIDENHPATYQSFKDYLERKQYGSESMVTRMFWRLGKWQNQWGIEGHIGFGGFFITQFFHFSPKDTERSLFTGGYAIGMFKLLIYLIPTMLMLFGWYYLYKRHWRIAIFLICFELLTTAAMVEYMNFCDGTRPMRSDYQQWVNSGRQGQMPVFHREVRVRDYFYITGFLIHGMWMGLAAGCLLHLLFTNRRKFLRSTVAPVCAVFFTVSPVLPMTQNFPMQTRNRDFLPFDYAYNMLMSCDKNALLFTNGDNDTFPLWALQEAYRIRTDVRIINLSLLNTDWYIKQLRDLEPKAAVTFNNQQIETLRPELNPFAQAVQYNLPEAHIPVVIPGRSEKHALLVQDKMVLNIVDGNAWKKPVYFALTVSGDNFMGLGPYLKMEGMVFRIMPQPVTQEQSFDMEKTWHFLDKVYQYRGLGSERKLIDETAQTVLSGYSMCFFRLTQYLRQSMFTLSNAVKTAETGTGAVGGTAGVADDELLKKKNEIERLGTLMNTVLQRWSAIMPWEPLPQRILAEVQGGGQIPSQKPPQVVQ